jgi:PAS domain S-box-containing protein
MNAMIQVLHLEDDPADAELVQARIAEAGFACRITNARMREEFEAALHDGGMDIILADYQLPMYDGMAALRLVLEVCPDVPFIVVSGTMGEEAAIDALTHGATDYVLKQNLSRLVPAVQRALQEARNQRERRQAEQALEQSEVKMRCILDSVDEGFIVIDHGYCILSANRAFLNLTNLSEDQVIGRPCHEILRHTTRPCFESGQECPVKHTFDTGSAYHASYMHEDASGTQSYLELKSYPIVDAAGTVTSVIEAVTDVTEKRRFQEQLVRTQKMESIARLAGGVAHDFNNMLSVIIGHTELAMEQVASSDPLFADLQEIRTAARRSASLTRQLLAFARKQTISPRGLDLNRVVADILNMLRPLIGEDINLDWRPGEGVWPVKMDPSQIDQILANLCINARDAIAGVGSITIQTERITCGPDHCDQHQEFVPGEYALLTVSDNGSGMDPETLSKIFEPFFTTKGIGQGTGLGLATVYGIVKQNNGFVDVDSNPGHGTTFKIYLPRHTAADTEETKHGHAAATPGGHETILLVEDEQSILKMTQSMLEKMGYGVLAASTPGEAIRLANAHDGDIRLLLVDVIMPEMDGHDLAGQVAPLYPDMVCLFMSGYSGDVIANHGVLDEGLHFIQKPFSMQELAAKVREVLDAY